MDSVCVCVCVCVCACACACVCVCVCVWVVWILLAQGSGGPFEHDNESCIYQSGSIKGETFLE
jgi:hypothetical protein